MEVPQTAPETQLSVNKWELLLQHQDHIWGQNSHVPGKPSKPLCRVCEKALWEPVTSEKAWFVCGCSKLELITDCVQRGMTIVLWQSTHQNPNRWRPDVLTSALHKLPAQRPLHPPRCTHSATSLSRVFLFAALALCCGTWASLVVVYGLSCLVACGIFVPWPRIEPSSPALEGRFLTNGPGGKCIFWSFGRCDLQGTYRYNEPAKPPPCCSAFAHVNSQPTCTLYLVRAISSPPCRPGSRDPISSALPEAPPPGTSSLLPSRRHDSRLRWAGVLAR